MHLYAIDNLQVSVNKREQGPLTCEVARGRDGNPVKHVRDVKRVKIETAACDTNGFVLTMERCEGMGDIVEVDVRAPEVLGREMGRFVWRRRREDFCS